MALHHTRRPATEAEARALASSLRLRILRLCLDRSLTNKEIAERLGARGAREIPYRATGKSWTVDVHETGVAGNREALIEAFLDEVRLVDQRETQLGRLGIRVDKEQLQELQQRMAALLDDFAAR